MSSGRQKVWGRYVSIREAASIQRSELALISNQPFIIQKLLTVKPATTPSASNDTIAAIDSRHVRAGLRVMRDDKRNPIRQIPAGSLMRQQRSWQ